jgi:hypothetical protein
LNGRRADRETWERSVFEVTLMFFQLIAEAASLSVTTRGGRTYLFEKGMPLKVDDRDIIELRGRSDVEECPEEGVEPRSARRPEPKSVVNFSGPSSQPRPQPAPHEPTPTELEKARSKLEGSKR